MSVHFKFKSAKDFSSIPIEGQFISIGTLKERIFELKHLGRGTDFDLVVSNAQTNEEYTDEAALIPRNTSVLIRRVPGRPRMPIVAEQDEVKAVEDNTQNITPATSNVAPQPSAMNPEESEWDEFGNDPYAIIPEGQPAQSFNPATVSSSDKLDEDSKIRALVETPFLDWSSQNDGYRGGRGYGRGMGGRMMGGRGFGRGLFEQRNPPPGYICHRCKVPGHFIQHCPTNGNPAYDVKRVKPPTGIPKSMLMATPDGSYALPNGTVAVLQPNEAAFEKEIEGIPTTVRAVTVSAELVPENLRCPLCKGVMKDAVLTSKCCFKSFCDKCIRDHIINKSKCVCGATHVLADDLLPNMTVRETISQILESAATSSQEKAGSFVQVQDMQSAVPVRERAPSPAVSGLKQEPKGPALVEGSPEAVNTSGVKAVNGNENSSDKKMKALVASDATLDSRNGKEPRSPKKSPLIKANAGKPSTGDQAKKKKKKKQRPGDDMQWRQYQEMGGVDGFGGMQMAGPGPNPFFGNALPPMAMDPFMGSAPAPFPHAVPPFMGLPPGPFGGVFPQVPDPFMAQPYLNMMPPAPRDLAELALGNGGMNMGPHRMMRREEDFDGRRVDVRRRRDMENHRRDMDRLSERSEREGRDLSRDRDARRERREVPSAREDFPVNKHKISTSSQAAPRPERSDRGNRGTTQELNPRERSHDSHRHSPRRSKKRPPADEAPPADPLAAADLSPPSKKLKASVFSRISFPEGGTSKKAKLSDSEVVAQLPTPSRKSSGGSSRAKEDRSDPAPSKESRYRSRRSYDDEEDESSDEDRHFKRRSRRKEADADVAAEERRQSRYSKEHDRTHRRRSSSRQRD